jgi:hypothetical protein
MKKPPTGACADDGGFDAAVLDSEERNARVAFIG